MSNVSNIPGLDPTLPDVTLILGGVERHLVFDFNAIVQAEKVTGVNMLRASIDSLSAESLRGLLWASLLKENPTLTLDQVGGLITMANATIIYKAIVTAWFGSVHDADDVSEDETPGEDLAQTPAV